MTLVEKLKNSVSEKFKLRVLELARVLDPKVDYVVVSAHKILPFKEELAKASSVQEGCTLLHNDTIVLNGFLVNYPDFKFNGDLIVVLSKKCEINRDTRQVFEKQTIIIFEHKASSLDQFRLGGK